MKPIQKLDERFYLGRSKMSATTLVGDIGGTKSILALFSENQLLRSFRFQNDQFRNFTQILEEFLSEHDEPIQKACFGVSGRIEKDRVQTTFRSWKINALDISQQFLIPKVTLINDLLATAYGTYSLEKKDIFEINPTQGRSATRAVLSIGTGFGKAYCFSENQIVPSEGGHGDFAPRSYTEIELLQFLRQKKSSISIEDLLSGKGLANIYAFLTKNFTSSLTPKEIVENSVSDPLCQKAIESFFDILAGVMQSVALDILPEGGIYIGGGITPKILPYLNPRQFFERFKEHPIYKTFLQTIPIRFILNEQIPLHGALHYCTAIFKH